MKLRLWVTLGAALVGFSSCDAFFTTNLFKEAGMGQESAADIASKSSADLAKDASSSGPDSTFYQVLTEDPATKAAVLATLADTYTSSTDPAAVQAAAAAAAKIELVTTGADELVNNMVGVLSDLPSGGFDYMSSADVVAALDTLIPPDLLSSQTAFTAAIQALLDAKTALDLMGASVGADGVAEIGTATVGSAAQAALVASVLDAIDLDTVDDPDNPGNPFPDVPSLLWAMLQPASTVDTSSLALDPAFDPTDPGNLHNLLIAGGLDLAALGL